MPLFGRRKSAVEPSPAVPVDEPLPRRTLDEQRDAVLAGVQPLEPRGLAVDQARGLALCERIVCDLDLPAVTRSLVDGYGLRRANIVGAGPDHPIDLQVAGVVDRLDRVPERIVAAGTCALLAAGAPVPAGVDAVVPLQAAPRRGRTVRFTAEAEPAQHLSLRGSRLADGDELLPAGAIVDAASAGLLAEVGLDEVLVRPKPVVSLVTVGPRLVATGAVLTALEQRYSGTAAFLAACLDADGAVARQSAPVSREAEAVRMVLGEASQGADVVVVLAEEDTDVYFVGELLEEHGSVDRAHVALNAGGPIVVGHHQDARVVVLPETPLSAFGLYHALIRPLLDRLSDRRVSEPGTCRLGFVVEAGDGVHLVPATLQDGVAQPTSGDGDLVYDLQRADGAVVAGPQAMAVGEEARWLPLPGRP